MLKVFVIGLTLAAFRKSHYGINRGAILHAQLFCAAKGDAMVKTSGKGLSPAITLERDSPFPLHDQISDGLRDAMDRGLLQPHTRLASTRILAREWGVSRNTVARVFATLTAEGYLVSRTGDGTYVCARAEAPVPEMPEEVAESPSFPFRSLSSRGQRIVANPDLGLPEWPLPFMPNVPDIREFPIRSWIRLMYEVSGGLTHEALAGVSSSGYPPLRRAIARHHAVTRGQTCEADQVFITTGTQQALDVVVRLLADPGDPVWMEEPGYGGIRSVLTASRSNIQNIPVDADGMDVAAGIEHFLMPRLICVTPARQFPTGVAMSEARRAALLDFAAHAGAWIIEDDFDSEMSFAAPPAPTLCAQDRFDRVILIGTFSTSMVPSLRLGYVIVPRDLIPAFEVARSITHGHASLLEQMVLAEMMNRGNYTAHLRKMRVLYKERQATLVDALSNQLDYTCHAHERASGMHLLLPFKPGVQDTDVVKRLAAAGVITRPLSPCYALNSTAHGLLLGFAAFTDKQILHATTRLRDMIDHDTIERSTDAAFADIFSSTAPEVRHDLSS
jgi:GntR family transcriptional regulator/MocR family aminotransferase